MRTTEILAALRLDASQFDRALRQSGGAIDGFKQKSAREVGGLSDVFARLGVSAGALPAVFRAGTVALTAFMGVKALQAAAQLKESVDGINGGIRNVSKSASEAATAQASLRVIAERTNQSYENTANLFTGVARAAESIGASQSEVLAFTQTVNQAILVGRKSAGEQAAALQQLQQAIASGRLAGDEYKSLTENAPRLVRALADGLKVSVGQLRKMSEEGKLTSEVVFGALISQSAALAAEVGNIPRTMAQARQGLMDEVAKLAADSGIVAAFRRLGIAVVDGMKEAVKKVNDPDRLYLAAPFGTNALRDEADAMATERLATKGGAFISMWGGRNGFALTTRGKYDFEYARAQDAIKLRDESRAAALSNSVFRNFGTLPGADGLPGVSDFKMQNAGRWQASMLGRRLGNDFTIGNPSAGDDALRREFERREKEAADRAKRLREEAARLREALEQELARTTQGVAAELQVQLDQWLAEMRKKIAEGVAIDPAQLAAIRAVRQAAIDAQRAIDAAQPAMAAAKAVLGRDADGSADQALEAQAATRGLEAALATLTARRDELAAVDATKRNLTAIKELDEEREALLKLITQLLERAGKSLALPGEAAKRVKDEMTLTANAIANAVDGAVALANAFGGVSNEMRQILANLTLVSRGVTGVFSTLGQLRTDGIGLGSLQGIASLAGAALPLVGGLVSLGSSLLATSPEEKARRDAMRANTDAIRLLTTRIGDLATSAVPGGSFGRVREAAIQALGPAGNPFRSTRWERDGIFGLGASRVTRLRDPVGAIASLSGLSREDVQAAADALRIQLTDDARSIRELVDAIDKADRAAYFDTFAGALERLGDTLRAEGVTDELEALRRRVAILGDSRTGFPALASALAGVDLESVEGRATALDRAQALFSTLQSGGLSFAQLGGASIPEARRVLLELIDSLRSTTQGGPAGTGGFNESRTITEVTGSRLAGLLGTANTLLAEIAANTASLRVAALPTLTPPSLGALGAAAGRGGVTVVLERGAINVTIPFGAGGDAAGAMALGDQLAPQLSDAIVRQLAAKLDAYLGQQGAQRRLLTGDPRLVS